jgi:NADPH:quinone reductase-like Zn-dependent oxidoreductase
MSNVPGAPAEARAQGGRPGSGLIRALINHYSGQTPNCTLSRRKADIADDLYKKVWPILSAGRCLPIIDKVFPLLNAADAHRRMEAGDHIGKIVLKVAE